MLERRLSSFGAAGESGSSAGPAAGRARGGEGEKQNHHYCSVQLTTGEKVHLVPFIIAF